ncbi:hypothetical protein NIES4075_07070 [Tolypothrix sp. NIES-4075]|uniref:hypothetical protein n=1 Tax=Tolypothrix sp. NIES-4075 TaxID=2005459 RepID=UPI000B5C461D|nr:hypothetical protein [Tolypothrix sp. NIES-4075]GAX39749.1 hypothetical protein NIES4075_07070 [Tolypothrix sp. NIES-4075]
MEGDWATRRQGDKQTRKQGGQKDNSYRLPITNYPFGVQRLCFSDAETLREQVARPAIDRTGSPITDYLLPITD